MLIDGVSWVWWLLATFGIGGTIALALFFPTVATLIANGLGKLFMAMIGTRVGVGLIVGVLTFIAADIHRSKLDQADWDKRTAAQAAAQKVRDQKIADDVRAQVTAEITAQQTSDDTTDKKVETFDATPPARAATAPCDSGVVGPDLGRLRDVAGTKPTVRSRAKRVRALARRRPAA